MSEQHAHSNGVNGVLRPAAPPVDVARRAVDNARAAQDYWKLTSLRDRVGALERAAKNMLRRRAEVVALVRDEMGKVKAEALFNEALGPLDQVAAWARVVEPAMRRRHVQLNPMSFPRKDAFVDRIPRGVVGVVAPWNFPVAGLYRAVLPALMTGNGVALKPSEYTPRSAAWFIGCLADELPEGLVQCVEGDGQMGAALIDAGIDACVFTGSPATGRLVAVKCAEHGIPSSIEMGGKDAAIVLGDCDLKRTVAGITHWALSNAGQSCGAIEVAYVDERVADRFVEAMRCAFTHLTDESVAPLAHRRQFDVVWSHIEDARAKGAKIICGGDRNGDTHLRLAPTLLDRCDGRMAVVTDETFGPVLAIVRVAGADDAIRAINASRYGLGTSIWTADVARGRRLAEKLDVGVVNINNHAFSGAIPLLPWSGTRATGFGVANGPEALSTFVRPRVTTVDGSRGPEVYWMPYDGALVDLGDVLADVQVGKVLGAWKLPLLVRRRLKTLRDFFA